MPPTSIESSFPLSIIILCYVATGLLVLILLLLFIMNSKLSALYAKLSRPSRYTKPESSEPTPDSVDPPDEVEATAGTHFEEFLNEDPERRKLTKKEKFKAYRAWRSEKGLNWSK